MRSPRRSGLLTVVVAAGLSCGDGSPRIAAPEELALRDRAIAHLADGRPGEALAALRALAGRAPEEPLVHANLALASLRQGEVGAAAEAAERALELAPADAAVRRTAALVAVAAGDFGRAVAIAGSGPAADPALAWVVAAAELEGKVPRRTATLDRLASALAAVPGNLPLRLQRATLVAEAGRAGEAARELRTIASLFPAWPPGAQEPWRRAFDAAGSGRAEEAAGAIRRVHNVLRPTPLYREGIREALGSEQPGGAPLRSFRVLRERRGDRDELPRGLRIVADSAPFTVPGVLLAAADRDADGKIEIIVREGVGTAVWGRREGAWDRLARTTIDAEAAAVADATGDGIRDVVLASSAGLWIWEGVPAGLAGGPRRIQTEVGHSVHAVAPGDLDHDGDLDLVVVGEGADRVLRNGLAAGLWDAMPGWTDGGAPGRRGRAVAFVDHDGDGDLDWVVAREDRPPSLYDNRREGRFADIAAERGLTEVGAATDVAVADLDADGNEDLLFAGMGGPVWTPGAHDGYGTPRPLGDETPPATSLAVLDLDDDGYLDVATGGDETGETRLLRGPATGGMEDVSRLLEGAPRPAGRVRAGDVDGDGDTDLLAAGPAGVRVLWSGGGETAPRLAVRLVGLGQGSGKNNHFGIGSRLVLRAGPLVQVRTVTDAVTRFGLRGRGHPQVLRVEWTNGVPQHAVDPPLNGLLVEHQVLKGSCPFLFTWTGEAFEPFTDIMWRSALGMPRGILAGRPQWHPTDASREYIPIPAERLRAKNGTYRLRITGELWEVAYLDEVRLMALDLPAHLHARVDGRYRAPADTLLRMVLTGAGRPLLSAVDGRGRDLTAKLGAPDAGYTPAGTPGRYQGIVEPWSLTLDPGARTPGDGRWLFLRGWIYPTDASIHAALTHGAGDFPRPPILQVPDGSGGWRTVGEVGFPAGKDKLLAVPLPEPVGFDRRVRIVGSMDVRWDHAFTAAEVRTTDAAATRTLPLRAAELRVRGFSREYRKGGPEGPSWYDYADVSDRPRWRPLPGRYTRPGPVEPLLRSADDQFVVFGPGDELHLEFAALPPPAGGLRRTFLLYTDSFLKDADLNTRGGEAVEPLPFHGMRAYPPRSGAPSRRTWVERWNTRVVEPAAGRPRVRPDPRDGD